MRGKSGDYVVSSPEFGIATQGRTREEALRHIKEEIEGVLEAGDSDALRALPHADSNDVQLGAVEVKTPTRQKVKSSQQLR